MLLRVTPLRLFVLAVAGQFIFGTVLALPGTLFGLASWTSVLGFDVPAQANLLVVFFACQCVLAVPAGRAIDRVGCERVLIAGGGLISAGFAMLASAEAVGAATLASALLASGGTAINASTNTMVSAAYGDDRGPMLSRMAVFGAAGSLMTPLMFGGASAVGVTIRLWQLAGAAACVVAAGLSVKIAPRAAFEPHGHPLQLLRDRWIVALTALVALEFGTEAIFGGWSAAFALAVVPEASPAAIVGLFWGGVCLARALAPVVLSRFAKREVVAVGAAVAAIAALGMATASTVLPLAAATFAVGLALGPLAPTLVSLAGDRYPRQMGTVIGLLLSVGQIGSTVLPWVTGRTAMSGGFRLAMVVPAVAISVVAAGALAGNVKRR